MVVYGPDLMWINAQERITRLTIYEKKLPGDLMVSKVALSTSGLNVNRITHTFREVGLAGLFYP